MHFGFQASDSFKYVNMAGVSRLEIIGRSAWAAVAFATFAMTLSGPAAANSDDVLLECSFIKPDFMKGDRAKIIADGAGITETFYQKNSGYVRSYTTNEKDSKYESYYRKNSFEISWGKT